MLGMMLLGLPGWSCTTGSDRHPVHGVAGGVNFLIGFALMIIGLLMTMRWR